MYNFLNFVRNYILRWLPGPLSLTSSIQLQLVVKWCGDAGNVPWSDWIWAQSPSGLTLLSRERWWVLGTDSEGFVLFGFSKICILSNTMNNACRGSETIVQWKSELKRNMNKAVSISIWGSKTRTRTHDAHTQAQTYTHFPSRPHACRHTR
jgi:hypothetical protein